MALPGLEIDDAIRALRPDFVALALHVAGVTTWPGTEDSERT